MDRPSVFENYMAEYCEDAPSETAAVRERITAELLSHVAEVNARTLAMHQLLIELDRENWRDNGEEIVRPRGEEKTNE